MITLFNIQSGYRYRASIKDGHLLENRVGSLIVTHIHSRPGMEQEQPLDLSLAESDYNRVSSE